MNQHGAAGATGFKTEDVVVFLDDHRVTVVRSGRQRKTINGYPVSANDARVIRRWRHSAKGATRSTVALLLGRHGLTLDDFGRWLEKRR